MKSILLITLISAASCRPALVSVDKVWDITTSSVELGYDLLRFGSSKIQETLTGDAREMYAKYVERIVEYRELVGDKINNSPARGIFLSFTSTIASALKNRYDAFNKLNHQYIDPIVVDFESRYPNSAGLLGHELGDRVLVAFWLYMFVKCTLRLVCRQCGACRNRSHK
jgi:hypothetical protein